MGKRIEVSVERLHPSGDYLCRYDSDDGEPFKFRYSGYSKREAVAAFREYVREELAKRKPGSKWLNP